MALDQCAWSRPGRGRPRARNRALRYLVRGSGRRAGGLRPRPVARAVPPRACDRRHGERVTVRDGAGDSRRLLRLGRWKRRGGNADGGEHVVFPRARHADAGPGIREPDRGDLGYVRPRSDAHQTGAATLRGIGPARRDPQEAIMRKFGLVLAVAAGIAGVAVTGRANAPQDGTVTGKVKFTGVKPAMPKIDMSDEAVGAKKYPTPPTDELVIVRPTGGLENGFRYVKEGLPAGATYPAPATPVELDQDGCRYHPHVPGILVGRTLPITNRTGV